MPTVEPLGERIRSLRKSLGWTQLELAMRADVSERTVRSIERDRPIKHDSLLCIALALGVEIRDIVRDPAQIAPLLCWRRNVDTLIELVTPYLQSGDPTGFYDIAHRDVEIVCRVEDTLPGAKWFSSSYFSGAEGARRFIDTSLQLRSQTVSRHARAQPPQGASNIVIIRGTELRTFCDGEQENTWWVRIFDFAEGRIRRLDEYVGASQFDWPEG